MGVVMPEGLRPRAIDDETAEYRCSACRKSFQARLLRFGDGTWAIVAAVFCSGDCMVAGMKARVGELTGGWR